MFYSSLVLTKKGRLGKVWIAATLGESHIPKQFAYEAKIDILCRTIEQPAAPFALRLSAHLMLGVTRVLSRKSSIVLSDVNSVLAAIHRHQTQIADDARSRRKRRGSGSISLPMETESARFDKITLPAYKKARRKSNETGTTGPPEYLLTQDASMDQYGRNPKWFLDNTLQSDAKLDLGANLEMEFPTIKVGSLFGSGSANSNPKNLFSQPSPMYRAREQDITLPPGSDLGFGSEIAPEVGFDILDANISLSLSIPASFSPQPQADPPNIAEAHQQFKDAFGIMPRQSSVQHVPLSVMDPMDIMGPPPDPVSIVQGDQSPAIVAMSPAGTTATGKTRTKRTSTETTSRKSKRTLRILQFPLASTSQTELTTSMIRDNLNDPSDTVLLPGAPRPYKKRKTSKEDTLGDLLLAYNPLPTAMGDFWRHTVVQPTLARLGIPAGKNHAQLRTPRQPHTGIQPLSSRKLRGDNGEKTGVQEFEMPPLPMLDDSFMLGQSAAIPMAVGALGHGEAAQASIAGSEAGAQSVPSGSIASGALSIAKSSSGGSKGPEILRDHELEIITEADQAAFESARRISTEFRLAALLQRNTPLKDTKNVGALTGISTESPSRRRAPTGDSGASKDRSDLNDLVLEQGNESNEQLPVGDSDLQLEEETEMERLTDSQKGLTVMERLNIRAFKILEILRTKGKEKNVSQSLQSITTFEDLVRDCSRRTKSRTFLHILALATLGFIRVEQTQSYGKINIFAGTFY